MNIYKVFGLKKHDRYDNVQHWHKNPRWNSENPGDEPQTIPNDDPDAANLGDASQIFDPTKYRESLTTGTPELLDDPDDTVDTGAKKEDESSVEDTKTQTQEETDAAAVAAVSGQDTTTETTDTDTADDDDTTSTTTTTATNNTNNTATNNTATNNTATNNTSTTGTGDNNAASASGSGASTNTATNNATTSTDTTGNKAADALADNDQTTNNQTSTTTNTPTGPTGARGTYRSTDTPKTPLEDKKPGWMTTTGITGQEIRTDKVNPNYDGDKGATKEYRFGPKATDVLNLPADLAADDSRVQAATRMQAQWEKNQTPTQGKATAKFKANNPTYNWNTDPKNPNAISADTTTPRTAAAVATLKPKNTSTSFGLQNEPGWQQWEGGIDGDTTSYKARKLTAAMKMFKAFGIQKKNGELPKDVTVDMEENIREDNPWSSGYATAFSPDRFDQEEFDISDKEGYDKYRNREEDAERVKGRALQDFRGGTPSAQEEEEGRERVTSGGRKGRARTQHASRYERRVLEGDKGRKKKLPWQDKTTKKPIKMQKSFGIFGLKKASTKAITLPSPKNISGTVSGTMPQAVADNADVPKDQSVDYKGSWGGQAELKVPSEVDSAQSKVRGSKTLTAGDKKFSMTNTSRVSDFFKLVEEMYD